MTVLSKFDTPARLRDAPAGSLFYDQWHSFISSQILATTAGDNGGAFYNPHRTDVTVAGEKLLSWTGFPRRVLTNHLDDKIEAYKEADANPDTRDAQDEYFEWRVDRDARGKITKLTFVTESSEYYQELWTHDPNLVVGLYQSLVNPAVTQSDLELSGGGYNKFNRWNTVDGIVHYIQDINTIPAAIGLSQGAVNSRPPNRDNFEATPGLATATTSVDPRVSFDIYMLVRKGLYVTLRDPLGLYIAGWNGSGLAHPDGSPAGDYWKITRGAPGVILRLEYEVPKSLGFVVGDMTLGGRPIDYGGQLAEQITVMIGGQAGIPVETERTRSLARFNASSRTVRGRS